jgi:hypothetical protein
MSQLKYYDQNSESWKTAIVGKQGETGKYYVSDDIAPEGAVEGSAWFNASNGKTYVYYDNYWIDISNPNIGLSGPAGPSGPSGPAGVSYTGIKNISNSTYTTDSSDSGKLLQVTVSSTITVAPYTLTNPGDRIDFVRYGSGDVIFVPDSLTTLNSVSTRRKLASQYSVASIIYITASTYLLIGDLTV